MPDKYIIHHLTSMHTTEKYNEKHLINFSVTQFCKYFMFSELMLKNVFFKIREICFISCH